MKLSRYIQATALGAAVCAITGCETTMQTKGLDPLPGPSYNRGAAINPEEEKPTDTYQVFSSKGIGSTAQQALRNALSATTERVVGTLVSALNQYTGDMAVDEAVKAELTKQIAQSSGKLIKSYKITSPWSSATNEVEIQAEVAAKDLMKNSIVQDLLKRKLDFPKFAILVKSKTGSSLIDLGAFNMISQRFSKYGFQFVPGTVSASYVSQVGKVATIDVAESVYSDTGARYIIIGNLTKGQPSVSNIGQKVQVSLDVEVIDAKTKQQLAAISETQTGTGNAQKAAEKSGLKKVLDVAFKKNKVAEQIYDVWLDSLSRFEKTLDESF